MGYKVVLTCDRTMASNYHGLSFLGFSACLPQGTLPDWLYYRLFTPSAKADKRGALIRAYAGLRKIEASLLEQGFHRDEVIVAHPDHLSKVIDEETKIVSICSIDPLGIGPATSTFTELWGGEGRMKVQLKKLVNHKNIKKYKPTLVSGGPGSWQFAIKPEDREELGIKHVIVGEGEKVVPPLFRNIINGETDIPTVTEGVPVSAEEIPDCVGGTVTGLVEVTRGCARSCAFCVPTLRKVRSRPVERIINEAMVNVESGTNGALLHGEDILLYKSDGLKVNSDAVIDLFSKVSQAPGINWVGASHASLSSVASAPEAVEGIAKVLDLGTKEHPVAYFQVGIETASPKLIERHMKGKVYPFKPSEWPDTIVKGMEICHNNNIICSGTIILGLPGEEPEDLQLTLDTIHRLDPYTSIVVPLLFTPMETTRLEYAEGITKEGLTELHHQVITACWEHNLKKLPMIWSHYGRNAHPAVKLAINAMMKLGTPIVRKRLHKHAEKNGVQLDSFQAARELIHIRAREEALPA